MNKKRLVNKIKRQTAFLLKSYYDHHYRVHMFFTKNKTCLISTVTLTLFATTLWLVFSNQKILVGLIQKSNFAQNSDDFFLTIGAALLGIAGIAFSFVMFAMQINVERMPYGLFQKFSSDKKLLGSFSGIIFLSFCFTLLFLITEPVFLLYGTFGAIWTVTLIFGLLFFSYQRALFLINPINQLNLLSEEAVKSLTKALKIYSRLAQLMGTESKEEQPAPSDFDASKAAYFQLNPNWDFIARRVTGYAISFYRRTVDKKDYETSAAALETILTINQTYVATKGKTFSSYNPPLDIPLTVDGFISYTLEQLRQNMAIAISEKDEIQIEQILRAYFSLACLYLQIEYSNESSLKYHAGLAENYLTDSVKELLPINCMEPVLQGLRLMGRLMKEYIRTEAVEDIASLVDETAIISHAAGMARKDSGPILQIGVQQLASTSLVLLQAPYQGDTYFLQKKISDWLNQITKAFLDFSTDINLFGAGYLAPYYTEFPSALTKLANNLIKKDEHDEHAEIIIRRILSWAEETRQNDKEIFLYAVEKESLLAISILHKITQTTKILIGLASAPVCKTRWSIDLQEKALKLISVISWLPTDRKTLAITGSYSITEELFEITAEAAFRECTNITWELEALLIDWAFKNGMQRTGHRIFEKSIHALIALSFLDKSLYSIGSIKDTLIKRINEKAEIPQETRKDIAENLSRDAKEYRKSKFELNTIRASINEKNANAFKDALNEIAEAITPSLKG